MKRLWVIALIGCHSHPEPKHDPVSEKQRFVDLMCDCRDPDCAMKVNGEILVWSAKRQTAGAPTLDVAQAKKLEELEKRLFECTSRASFSGLGVGK
jgi:hypothetical protein